jgi:hypothetical protein
VFVENFIAERGLALNPYRKANAIMFLYRLGQGLRPENRDARFLEALELL